MLVGASFCLIFKSHTKFLTFVSENDSRGTAVLVSAACCVLGPRCASRLASQGIFRAIFGM